jgi:hypothetical protein
MKLRVQLQGVSVTGYRVKEDGEDKKKKKKKKKKKIKKKHTNDTKNQLDRGVVKLVMLACPGGVVLGYV